MGNTGKDSISLSLDDNLGTFIGKISFKNLEKDSTFTVGDVMGTQNGDTLKLSYTFQAEGLTSDREIYFLKKDGNLVEGLGEQKVEGSKSLYSTLSKLKYEGSALKQTDCKDFEKKFATK